MELWLYNLLLRLKILVYVRGNLVTMELYLYFLVKLMKTKSNFESKMIE